MLGHLGSLDVDPARLKLFWAVRRDDVDFVADTFKQFPKLGLATEVFITGGKEEDAQSVQDLFTQTGTKVHMRRLSKSDLEGVQADKWYLCAGKLFRKQVLGWLEGKEVVFEDFDY